MDFPKIESRFLSKTLLGAFCGEAGGVENREKSNRRSRILGPFSMLGVASWRLGPRPPASVLNWMTRMIYVEWVLLFSSLCFDFH